MSWTLEDHTKLKGSERSQGLTCGLVDGQEAGNVNWPHRQVEIAPQSWRPQDGAWH